jgi:predicted cytidylate kinase
MIITLSGAPGSGKSTVARMLARRLGFRYYSMGKLVRGYARQHHLKLADLRIRMAKNPAYDRRIDATAARLGKTRDDFILEGRLGFHFIPHSVKAYLTVDTKEAARRIWRDVNAGKRREEEGRVSLARIYRDIRRREADDVLRYRKFYRVNPEERKHYDIVISTTRKTPERVVSALVRWLRKHPQKARKR